MHVDVPVSASVRTLRERVLEADRSVASSSGFKWRGVRLDDKEDSMLRSLGIVDGASVYVMCLLFERVRAWSCLLGAAVELVSEPTPKTQTAPL